MYLILVWIGTPIIATLPHFLKSEYYLNDVTGLNPNIEKHGIKMYFEPVSRFYLFCSSINL